MESTKLKNIAEIIQKNCISKERKTNGAVFWKKHKKQIPAWIRAGIQLLFFVFFPSAFTAAFSGVKYIAGQMVYPVDLLEKNIPGFALCEFTIDKEGVILRPHILRSTHPEFAEEALRIVKGMPKWSPALGGGKPADSNYTLYVPFRPQLYRNK